MDILKINDYIKNPLSLTGKADFELLHQAENKYPYCQSFHILLAIAGNLKESYFSNNHLEKAALYAGERTNLYRKIVKNELIPIRPSVKKLLYDNNREDESNMVSSKKQITKEIINRFISENPNIQKPKTEFYNPADKALKSIRENEEFATETLASIYIKIGKLDKAIKIYEKLSLLYPEKSDYFALQINMLISKREE